MTPRTPIQCKMGARQGQIMASNTRLGCHGVFLFNNYYILPRQYKDTLTKLREFHWTSCKKWGCSEVVFKTNQKHYCRLQRISLLRKERAVNYRGVPKWGEHPLFCESSSSGQLHGDSKFQASWSLLRVVVLVVVVVVAVSFFAYINSGPRSCCLPFPQVLIRLL